MRTVLELAGPHDSAAVEEALYALGGRLLSVHSERAGEPRLSFYTIGGAIVTLEEGDVWRLTLEAHDTAALAAELLAALPAAARSSAAEESAAPPVRRVRRPRVRPTVELRRDRRSDRVVLELTDERSRAALSISPEERVALVAADGTRDRDGLLLACAAAKRRLSRAELDGLLARLEAADLLIDGLAAPQPARTVPPPPPPPASLPMERLPGYRLHCDGRGRCCESYGAVPFTAPERARALRVLDKHEAGGASELFTPLTGVRASAGAPSAVALVEGACAFFERPIGCALHAAGGAASKPLPCRLYPASLVSDGVSVRVSVGPECACAYASDGVADGGPIIDDAWGSLDELPAGVGVTSLPEPVPVHRSLAAPRSEVRSWSARVEESLRSPARGFDCAARAFGLAAALGRGDLRTAAPDAPVPPEAEAWLEALGAAARDRASPAADWRGGSLRARRVAAWIADAIRAAAFAELTAAPSPQAAAAERFYLRALVFGHRLASGARPLSRGAFDRGVRVLAARAMALHPEAHTSEPGPTLAPLEAAARNLRLADYADHLALPGE